MKRLLLALALLLVSTVTYAALPTFWQVSTESELLRGEVENLAIDSFGPHRQTGYRFALLERSRRPLVRLSVISVDSCPAYWWGWRMK